jgi:hypothetical protein
MLLEFLNQNSGVLAIVFSAVVAIATIVYAFLTWKLVSETRRMRKAQTRPIVSVITQSDEKYINFIEMIIENIGLGVAYNIKFEVNPDFEYAKGKFLSDLGFVKNDLKYLAPNQKLKFFLTNLTENFEEKTKKPFEINITYENSTGERYEDKFLIDFSGLIGLRQLGE